VPLVLYNRVGEDEPVASVCCDSAQGERVIVDRLVAAGHASFGIIAGPADSYVGEERVNAALERLRGHGRKAFVVRGAFDYASGGDGLRALMRLSDNGIDAVICANDLMALGALDCARDIFGLDVPGRLSVVGFDGVGPATWTAYGLTTVRQPVRRMTEAAVSMLVERIEDGDVAPERRLFAGDFVEGRSARLGT
jgi:DNA-binding LacI/PurR family transcriptional regulator